MRFVVALFCVYAASASTGPISLKCDRSCLEGEMDQYLKALVAHKPKALPLSADVIYTENDQQMQVGQRVLEND